MPDTENKITLAEYNSMVSMLKKPGEDILAQMTPEKADLNHMAMGVNSEAGELTDAVKRFTMYDKPIDRDNVIEELGDLEFFMQGLRERLGITRDETLLSNIAKLGKRYHQMKYSDAQAQARADKETAKPLHDFKEADKDTATDQPIPE